MTTYLDASLNWLRNYPELYTLFCLTLLLLAAWLCNWIVKRILVKGVYRLLSSASLGLKSEVTNTPMIARLANVVPALILSTGILAVPGLPEALVTIVGNVCSAFIILTIVLAISNLLDIVNAVYQRRPDARFRPIKGYIQVLKIGIFCLASILIIATLIDRSPLILLSGLGAMAAVLLLIFQDTLLSLVASVQISSGDIVRIGDWIEMPQLNASGDVIDIALHTVKVQNFDKTITTIPTKRFISDAFKNYRGMQESGGRRIKRSLFLDQQSVHFIDGDEYRHLHRFSLLADYLDNKQKELKEWNDKLAERGQEPVNTRRITNLGTFRVYVERYLRSHSGLRQDMTLLVRQLDPTSSGLPLEVYCFTNTVIWAQYENIQSDIFDHLLAILPEFGLRIYQQPSGADMRAFLTSDRPINAVTSLDDKHLTIR